MRLSGKTAIVTGGAQGIGAAFVRALFREGADVVSADLQDSDELVREAKDFGARALSLKVDVTSEDSTRKMADIAAEEFGGIDILVNNAAFFSSIVKKPFHEIKEKEWNAVMSVNLKGAFLCAKSVYPYMKNRRKGKIINISSGTVYKGLPLFLHYVTSKGGIIAFTRSLAREVGDVGICVNTIAPGYTETERLKERPQDPEEVIQLIIQSRCLKRAEEPDDLTGALIFLSSDESDFITGQTIVVDGGSAMS